MSRTYGEMMDEALAVKTQAEADAFFKREVDDMQKANPAWTLDRCEFVVRANLGYMAGYYDKKASEHVAKFWGARHPIFGGPEYWETVTPEEAFTKGKEAAGGQL